MSRLPPYNIGGKAEIRSDSKLFHSQDGGVRAQSFITWDGDSDGTNKIKANGLGKVDFYADGGRNIIIHIASFDYANSANAKIRLRLYDASSEDRFSDVIITLDRVINDFPIKIPLELFSNRGLCVDAPYDPSKPTDPNDRCQSPNLFKTETYFDSFIGPPSLSNIGAIEFAIDGSLGDTDLAIYSIKTDGRCTSVPNASGAVIDACNVCLEDPGVDFPNGKRDRCGICFKDPADPKYKYEDNKIFDACNLCPNEKDYSYPSGTKDRCGVCLSGSGSYTYNTAKTIDECGLCPGELNYKAMNGERDICGVCLSGPSPYQYKNVEDVCKICDGNGTTCVDCKGVPFGTAVRDICNVCGGDGKSCLDCAGVPFGTSKLDACGTCGGKATDPNNCFNIQCVTVKASSEILAFEKRLVNQTKTITKKFREEDKRNTKNKCGINTKPSSKRVETAYNTITKAGKEIFNKGVEICGDACVTVSFADQVLALSPQLSLIEKETSSLAKKVQACYKRKGIKTTQSVNGVATTIKNVKSDLKQLVKDCKDKLVCR